MLERQLNMSDNNNNDAVASTSLTEKARRVLGLLRRGNVHATDARFLYVAYNIDKMMIHINFCKGWAQSSTRWSLPAQTFW